MIFQIGCSSQADNLVKKIITNLYSTIPSYHGHPNIKARCCWVIIIHNFAGACKIYNVIMYSFLFQIKYLLVSGKCNCKYQISLCFTSKEKMVHFPFGIKVKSILIHTSILTQIFITKEIFYISTSPLRESNISDSHKKLQQHQLLNLVLVREEMKD